MERPSPEVSSFDDRLQERRSQLPHAMQKVIRLIEHQPALFIDGTITSLAGHADVAPSAITRLSHALGYPNVARMRMAVADEYARSGGNDAWANDLGTEFAPGDDPDTLLATLAAAHLQMVRNAAAQLDVAVLQAVAERIAGADRVDLYAIGASANAADRFTDQVFRLGVQIRSWREVHIGLMSASFLSPASVAIAISRSGRTPEVAQLLGKAATTGAHTVALVGQPNSPIAAVADQTVILPPGTTHGGVLTSRNSQGFTLDFLFLLLTRLDEADATRHLADTGRSVERHRRDQEQLRHDPWS